MKIVFFGTPQIAADVLKYLLEQGIDIPLVVTKPDRPKGRSDKLVPSPVKVVAEEKGIPVIQPEKISTEDNEALLKELEPDLFVVVAYGEIIKQNILDVPKKGSINLHASLLPKYRGAAPIQRALMEGEKVSGVSIIRLVRKMDAGPILCKKQVDLPPWMRANELFSELEKVGKIALLEVIQEIAMGSEKEEIQDEALVTFAHKLELEDCELDFQKSAWELHNLARGAHPHPGAWFTIALRGEKKKVKVIRSLVREDLTGDSGVVIDDKKELLLGTSQHVLQILDLKVEGKKEMKAGEWLKGSYKNFTVQTN